MEKLQPGLRPGAGSAQAATNLDEQFTNDTIEMRAQSEQGRQEMFHDAGAMMEMADYAERNGDKDVAPIVASLRGRATAIRIGVVKRILRRQK